MRISAIGQTQKFEVIGHRGNSGNPLNSLNIENTIPAFNSAFALGANGIELDVILTKNRDLVVHHDDRLGRVFLMAGNELQKLVSEYNTWQLFETELNLKGLTEELLKKDSHLTKNINVKFPFLYEVQIPKDKKLFLELKFLDDKLPQDKTYLKAITKAAVEFITEHGLTNQTYVLCFVPEALDEVKNLNDKITTAHNIHQGEASDLEKIKQLQKSYGFDIMNPPFAQATKEAIENMHHAGVKTYPWVWKEGSRQEIDEVRRLFLEEADGVISNQVEAALNAIY